MFKTLQNTIFTIPQDTANELYIRYTGNIHEQDGRLFLSSQDNNKNQVSFDTYFNSFSLSIWRKYTKITNLYLTLELNGSGTLFIVGVDAYNDEHELLQYSFHTKDRAEIRLRVPTTDSIIVFFRISTQSCTLFHGRWETQLDEADLFPVILSIGICTWKREAFVRRTVTRLSAYKQKHHELVGRLFIHIADNGQTLLPEDFPHDDIFLHPNVNAGGSGGFSRCMLETLAQTPPATHILLMDDDIDLEPESVFRTITVLELLKPEYSQCVVAGSLLNLHTRHIQLGRGGELSPTTLFQKALRSGIDIRKRSELITNDTLNTSSQHCYAAWCYYAFPLTFLAKGLSFPFFYQVDDIEFSLRNAITPIYINGIAVWHEFFHGKIQSSKRYYGIRNKLIMSSLCSFRKSSSIVYLTVIFFKELCTFNYTAVHYLLQAINDFLAGPAALPTRKKWDTRPNFPESSTVTPVTKAPLTLVKEHKKTHWAKLVIALLTLNGHLLPDFLLGEAAYIPGTPYNYLGEILCKRSIRIFDTTMCLEYRLSRKEAGKCLIHFCKVMFRYIVNYNNTAQTWRRVHTTFTSPEWWKNALELNKTLSSKQTLSQKHT